MKLHKRFAKVVRLLWYGPQMTSNQNNPSQLTNGKNNCTKGKKLASNMMPEQLSFGKINVFVQTTVLFCYPPYYHGDFVKESECHHL